MYWCGEMRGKKAWLRILEAFIAILLVSGVLIVVYSRVIQKPGKEDIYNLETSILEEIAENSSLRDEVLKEMPEISKINDFVQKRIPPGFSFRVKICDVEVICQLDDYLGEEGKEIYSDERMISSVLERYQPKILKIFMWEA